MKKPKHGKILDDFYYNKCLHFKRIIAVSKQGFILGFKISRFRTFKFSLDGDILAFLDKQLFWILFPKKWSNVFPHKWATRGRIFSHV
jgi:hypothetical protein